MAMFLPGLLLLLQTYRASSCEAEAVLTAGGLGVGDTRSPSSGRACSTERRVARCRLPTNRRRPRVTARHPCLLPHKTAPFDGDVYLVYQTPQDSVVAYCGIVFLTRNRTTERLCTNCVSFCITGNTNSVNSDRCDYNF
jgi:hypothetical protein